MEITKFGKDSMFQRIKASYIDETFTLKPNEIAKKERLEKIWALRINNKYSPTQTVAIIMRDYTNEDGTPVSRATAYRDYSWSMAIFGDIDQLNKAAEKMVLAEIYFNELQKAINSGNGELVVKAGTAYERILGLDKSESMNDILKYKSNEITLKISAKQNKAIAQFFQLGVADFNNFDAEDVPYEDVNDDEDDDDEQFV